jgi:hypothetical protein
LNEVVLDPESYCPKQTLSLNLYVPWNQSGGRGMLAEWIEEAKKKVVDDIIDDLRFIIEEYVDTHNPYSALLHDPKKTSK